MRESKSIVLAVCLLAIIPGTFAHAQSSFWMAPSGPFGGNVRCLTRSSGGTLFTGNAFHGVFRSSDGGRSWEQTNLDSVSIQVMATGKDGALFAGGPDNHAYGISKIYRSTDGGISWSIVSTATSLWAIAADTSGTVIFSGYEGITRSTDNGNDWTFMNGLNERIYSLAIDGSGAIFCGSRSSVWRSTDEGQTWDSSSVGVWADVYGIAADDSETVFATTWGNGAYRSTDQGASWQSLNVDPSEIYFLRVARAPDGSILILGSQNVYRSTDGGENWSSLGGGPYYFKTCVVGAPDGSIVVGTEKGGTCWTHSDGESWKQSAMVNSTVAVITVDAAGVIYAGTDGGLFSSSDQGATWEQTTLTDIAVESIVTSEGGRIFATVSDCDSRCSGAVFRSTDGGQTWEPTDSSPGPFFIPQLAVTPSGKLFAINGFFGNSLYGSNDDGTTWNKLADSLGYCLRAASTGELYVGGTKGIFKSSDDGQSWGWLTDSVSEEIALARDGWLYSRTLTSVIRSSDGGLTWLQADEALPPEDFIALTVGPQGEVYLASGSRLYVSRTHGSDWSVVDDLPTGRSVSGFAIDSLGYLYAGTGGRGVIRSVDPTTTVDESSPVVPGTYSLPQNYPNPFNPSTTIEFSIARSGPVELKVFDILGREVVSLAKGILNPGVHKVMWDATGVTSGLYIYQLRAGSFVEAKKMLLIR